MNPAPTTATRSTTGRLPPPLCRAGPPRGRAGTALARRVVGRCAMAELRAKQRDRLKKSDFAYVDKDGGEHLPIHDEEHVRNAIARFNQTHFESQAAKEEARRKILAAARRHGIEV